MDKVYIFDTTLRDGEQALRSSLSVKEKIVIARALTNLNVDIIEAGFPVSSPGDFESVKTIAEVIDGPVICGLARAVEKDIDACAQALKNCKNPRIHTFIGTSAIHATSKLRRTDEEILDMAVSMVKYARRFCDDVEFSCEDAGRTDPDVLCRIVESAIKAGARTVNIPDTVGYVVGTRFGEIIADLFNRVPNIGDAIISVHCHNDLGQAVSNSVQAVINGARQVECTVNGIGERAGNAALEEIAMILRLHSPSLNVDTGINTKRIYDTSRLVSRMCNMPIQPNKAIVGANAFVHSSGIHQDGMIKNKLCYEIMTPESIGLKANALNLTSRSGRAAVKNRLADLGYTEEDYNIDKVYENFLKVADRKGVVYDDDLIALIEIGSAEDTTKYKLTYLNATAGKDIVSTATVKVDVEGEDEPRTEAATGDGPVDAAYKAIDRVTGRTVKVIEYSLAAATGGRDALGDVKIIGEKDGIRYYAHGSSTDIVEASALAYINLLNKLERMAIVEQARINKNKSEE
ncbi:MAG: 2-isopropylmalate synthase [Spartobacteria bacterium]|nr:2-isopropylmalate synthase [Spartobacteria bacterium]